MAKLPRYSRYKFLSQLADNGFTEAWKARDLRTGELCFVKRPSQASSLPLEFILETLRNSITLQQQVPAGAINRAVNSQKRGDDLLVVYPWLSEAVTYPEFLLDVDLLPQNLLQVAILTDYLHAQGLVHRDLKLSNFLCRSRGGRAELVMTDLDLLAEANVRSDQKVFGTPGFIAPEVEVNRAFSARSDLYSLGRSLDMFGERQLDGAARAQLRPLVERLTEPALAQRPEYLLETLRATGWITDEQFRRSLKTVFTLRFLSCYRRRAARRPGWLTTLVYDRLHLLGLSREFLDDLERVYEKVPRQAGRAIRRLFERSHMERYGDFWQLVVTDREYVDCYNDLGIPLTTISSIPPSTEVADVSPRLTYRANDNPLKRYLQLNLMLTDGNGHPGQEEAGGRWHERGDLAMILGRTSEASQSYDRAVEHDEVSGSERLVLLRKQLLNSLIERDWSRFDDILTEARRQARQLEDEVVELDLLRQEIWSCSARGDHAAAKQKLRTLEAADAGEYRDLMKARIVSLKHQMSAMTEDHSAPVDSQQALVETCLRSGNAGALYHTRVRLAMAYFELGRYRDCISLVEEMEDTEPLPHQTYFKQFLYNSYSMALVRSGRFDDARRALHASIQFGNSRMPKNHIIQFYGGQAWINIELGQLAEAESQLYRCLALLSPDSQDRSAGQIYHNLTNVAMRRGQTSAAEQFGQRAISIYDRAGSSVSSLEVRVLMCLNQIYNHREPEWSELVALIAPLRREHATFYAATALFHCLVGANDRIATAALKEFGSTEVLDRESVPVYRAARELLDQPRRRGPDRARALKEALRLAAEASELYACLVLCRQIAELSLAEGSRRRARSYFEMALDYARQLTNQLAEHRLTERVAQLSESDDVRKATLDSIISITELFTGEQHNETALERMLRFAINETGAERGALLLRNSQTGELTLRASVDCDAESLDDITDLSSNLLDRAVRLDHPYVVEDALKDADLNQFPSIVDHNIRSVIAVPIFEGSLVSGLLYLDHHTVPAKFEHADISYLKLIARFVSRMLNTLREIRAVHIKGQQVDEVKEQLGYGSAFVSVNASVKAIMHDIPQMARTNADILIQGESGTGKELLVDLIHRESLRRDKPFVKVNCAALDAQLAMAELFGIADRTATGVRGRPGKFEEADGGTLFFDEIGDMPYHLQAAVLTAVEYQRIQKPGGRDVHVDVRMVYATNKDLEAMIEAGTFRLDLYQRINTLQIVVPPLRERRDDIRPLVEHFVRTIGGPKVQSLDFTSRAWDALQAHDWPGNVRELRNLVERLIILRPHKRIDLEHLQDDIRKPTPPRTHTSSREARREQKWRQLARDLDVQLAPVEPEIEQARQPGHTGLSVLELLEREIIRVQLRRKSGNMSRTAEALGMAYNTLRRRIQKYGLRRS